MSTSLGVGLHFDVDPDRYHTDPCERLSLSASIAHTLVSRSPLHAWFQHPKLGAGTRKATKEMDRGSVGHALLLGTGKQFAVVRNPKADELDPKTKEPQGEFTDWKRKAAQEARDAIRAEGKIPLLQHQVEAAEEMAEAIAARLWSEFRIKLYGKSEVAMVWEEELPDGRKVLCRGQADHFIESERLVIDLKLVRSAHPKACQSHYVGFGGHIQGAAYLRAIGKLRPHLAGRLQFLNLFCEAEEPYAITPVWLRGSMLELGERRWLRALPIWADCVATNKWPAYVTQPTTVEAPGWAMAAEEEAAFESFGGQHDEPEGPSDSAPSNGDSNEYREYENLF